MIYNQETHTTINGLTTYYGALLGEAPYSDFEKVIMSDSWERHRSYTHTKRSAATIIFEATHALYPEGTAVDAQAHYQVTLLEQEFYRRAPFSKKVGELLLRQWRLSVSKPAHTVEGLAVAEDIPARTNAPLGDTDLVLWMNRKDAWYAGEAHMMAQKHDVHAQTGRALLREMQAATELFLPHQMSAEPTSSH